MTGRKYRDGEIVDFAIVGSGVAGGTIARSRNFEARHRQKKSIEGATSGRGQLPR